MRERGYGCVPALALSVGAIAFLQSARARQWLLFRLWLLLLATVIAGDAYRKGGLYRSVRSLLERIFIMDGMVRGFFLKPAEPESYPGKLEIIKRAPSGRSRVQSQEC